jgi:hypothetical protein
MPGEVEGRFKPGENVSVQAAETLEGGRFVKISGAKTAKGSYPAKYAAEKSKAGLVFGVTQRSAASSLPADSKDRLIECMRPGSVVRVLTQGEVKVGEEVMVGAEGKAKVATENPVGVALTTGADGVLIEVDFRG